MSFYVYSYFTVCFFLELGALIYFLSVSFVYVFVYSLLLSCIAFMYCFRVLLIRVLLIRVLLIRVLLSCIPYRV